MVCVCARGGGARSAHPGISVSVCVSERVVCVCSVYLGGEGERVREGERKFAKSLEDFLKMFHVLESGTLLMLRVWDFGFRLGFMHLEHVQVVF